ncbi:MAG: sigma-70 family RNA polymerase sigma factor [Ilumatobacteraceae bacterium]
MPTSGRSAPAEALAYGWEHWERVGPMENPVGYLYRVGQTAARRLRRPLRQLPVPGPGVLPDFEPTLVPALRQLSEGQRVCVLMVHGFGWRQAEVAELLEISPSSVRTHLSRGLASLRAQLKVVNHAD